MDRSRRVLAGVAVVVVLVAAGCGNGDARVVAAAPNGGAKPASANTAPAAAATTAASQAVTIPVRLSDFHVGLPSTTFTPGHKSLVITNDGKLQHELLVFRSDLDPSRYPLDHGDINEDGAGITKISDGDNIDPGGTQNRIVDLSEPGTYLFVCNLPGHFHAGMWTKVTVGNVPEASAVTLSEFKVDVPTHLAPGRVTFTITNAGKLAHELLVFHATMAPDHFALDPDGTIQEDAPGMNKVSDGDNIDPGKAQTRTVDLSTPGTYVFVCNLPGHFKAGMYTVVTVG